MDQMERPVANERLLAARQRKQWSQQTAAEQIGIDRKTYVRLEKGHTHPQPGTLTLLCTAFAASADDLGFAGIPHSGRLDSELGLGAALAPLTRLPCADDGADPSTRTSLILARIVHGIGAWNVQGLIWGEMQAAVNEDIGMLDEMLRHQPRREESLISRRQALLTLAALPTALLGQTPSRPSRGQRVAVSAAEFLPHCAASLTACWHLLRGDDLVAVAHLLPRYMPTLTALASQPTPQQHAAAALAAQGNILQAIVAMHQLNVAERERYCREAVRCGYLSRDSSVTAAALMYLGYTYSFNYRPRRPEQAIHVFHEAVQVLGHEDALLESDILMGIAEAYAQRHDVTKARAAMTRAQEQFPTYPAHAPSYLYAECGLNVLYQWEGKMYLELAERYPERGYAQRAWEALARSADTRPINGRSGSETVLCQADAARLRGDVSTYTEYLRDGLHRAASLGSRKRYAEVCELYRKTPEPWLKEQPLKALAHDVFGGYRAMRGHRAWTA